MRIIALLSLCWLLCSCAVGPLYLNETARPVGDGHSELAVGAGNGGYLLKFNYGLSPRWDLGVQLESMSMGLRAKYGILVQQKQGWSVATALGTGISAGGSHYYADLMTSHIESWWEPYGNIRIVHVKTDPQELRNDSNGFRITVPSFSYQYGQAFLGSRFWFTPRGFFMSLEVSSLFALSRDLRFGDGAIVGLALGYHF